jgi:polyisoprenoid-binding protein YceI
LSPGLFGKICVIACLLATLAACGSSTPRQAAADTPVATVEQVVTPAPDPAPTEAPAPSPNTEPAMTTEPAGVEATQTSAGAQARTFRIIPEQTEARYEVQEQFLNRDLPSRAVGKTNAVEGEFQFALGRQPTGKVTRITVDLRTLTSDEGRRDNRLRSQWLESDTYPYAEFTSTEVQDIPQNYVEGQEVSFKLAGDMTIRDIAKPVTFDVKGKLEGDTVTGTATTQIKMTDFSFDPPAIAGMLTVEDDVTIVVDFTAKEVSGQ